MSGNILRRSATFAGLTPRKIFEVLCGIKQVSQILPGQAKETAQLIDLKVTKEYCPDFLELQAISEQLSFLFRCYLLPVDSDQGSACEITFKRIDETDSPLNEKAELLLLTEIGWRLRKAGAIRAREIPLTSVVGDRYTGTWATEAVHTVSNFACTRRELHDSSRNMTVRWYADLLWSSPLPGVVAVMVHYTSVPAGSGHVFLRWFFHENTATQLVELTYKCSAAGTALANPQSVEWRIIKEMVKLTRQHLCRAGARSLSDQLAESQAVPLEAAQVHCNEIHASANEPEWVMSQFWPTAQDYNESIQNLTACTEDPEIQRGILELNSLGLPRVVSGAFASVYRIRCPGHDLAVRCFVRPVKDQAERYRRMSRFICSDDLACTLDVHFVEKGILVRGHWFPIIKMEWIEGEHFNDFISRNLKNNEKLRRLRRKFWLMLLDLARAGVAHGDLQHGNVLVKNGELILLDYDGMFVPDLSEHNGREKGHPNYQHPCRESEHFGPYLDHFSAWVIDTALLAVSVDPDLWARFGAGDESFLFTRTDFLNPERSKLFQTFARHDSRELRDRAAYLRTLLSAPVEQIPGLEPGYPDLVARSKNVISTLPEWINKTDIS